MRCSLTGLMYTERPVPTTVIRRYDDERILGNDVADALEKVQAPEG